MAKDKTIRVASPPSNPNVNVKKATNGFVISYYDKKKGNEVSFIAKNAKEALKVTSKILK